MRARPGPGEGQDGVAPVQRLNRGLLIHAEDRRMRRRMEIEADDVRRLALEVGIRTGDVALQAVRLEPRPAATPGAPWPD